MQDNETRHGLSELFKFIEKSPLSSDCGSLGGLWPSWFKTGHQGSYLMFNPEREDTVRWRRLSSRETQRVKPEEFERVVQEITREYLVAALKGDGTL